MLPARCIYQISVPRVDIGQVLILVGATLQGNGKILQGNKYTEPVPECPLGTRRSQEQSSQMLSILLSAALLAAQVSSSSLPRLGKYATLVHPRQVANTTYNFIIAGGGIGGLTVADRLTEDPNGKSPNV